MTPAAERGAGWCEEGHALCFGTALRPHCAHGDFVLAGEQQARQVDVVLLNQEIDYSALTLTLLTVQIPVTSGDKEHQA